MTDQDKTAAEILRELREGMTPSEWRAVNTNKTAYIYGDNVVVHFVQDDFGATRETVERWHADTCGIVALVNAMPEIEALVGAIEPYRGQFGGVREAFDALTAKLREQTR